MSLAHDANSALNRTLGRFAANSADARADRLPLIVLIYLLAVVIPIAFNLGPVLMTGLRLVLLITIVPVTIGVLFGRYGPRYWTDYLFLIHVFWMAVAFAVNNPDKVVENIGSTAVEFLGGYMIARAYIQSRGAFISLCRVFGIILLVTFPFTVFEALTGRPPIVEFINALPIVFSVDVVTIPARMGFERAQVILAHPIHYGLFSSLAFSLTFVALKDEIGTPRRYLTSAVIGACVFFSLSSGALLAIIFQIGLIGWAWVFRGVNARWWILLGLFVVMYVAIDLLSNRTPLRVFMSYATFSPGTAYWRSIIFEWGMKNVWGSPIFGIGLNNWVRPFYMVSGSMDNFWLVMAVRYGIPGWFFVTAGYAYAVLRIGLHKCGEDKQLERLRLAWMITFGGLTFSLVTVHVWTNLYSFVFFVLGAGFWILTEQPKAPDGGEESGDREDGPGPSPGADRKSPYTRFPIKVRDAL